MTNKTKLAAAYLLAATTWLLLAAAAREAHTQEPQQEGPPPPAELGEQLDKRTVTQQQQQQQYRTNNRTATNNNPSLQKCARQSILLARQMLAHELTYMNQFNSIWFNDLDRDELLEGQKHSLSNIVMSGAGTSLLNSNGQLLIEIESSYFRSTQHGQPLTIKLLRRHQDRCHLNPEKRQFTYVLGLTLGPLEHHLDVVYNLPKDLGLSQPLNWRYGQICLSVPRMNYEITLRQAATTATTTTGATQAEVISTSGCALEIADVTYLSSGVPGQPSGPSIRSYGLAVNNQTLQQVDRLFDDYTRPTVSARLRQLLKFYLNTKTLPLATPPLAAPAADY